MVLGIQWLKQLRNIGWDFVDMKNATKGGNGEKG